MKDIGISSLIYYVSFTLIFFILKKIYKFPGTSWIWFFLVITGLIQFFNNLYLTHYPEICNGYNISSAFTATIVPWLFIFGLSCVCLVFIPGWLRVFSNTFGSTIVYWGGINTKVNNLFTPISNPSDPETSKTITEAINLLYANRIKFINEVDISDYNETNGKITWPSLQNILTFMNIPFETKGPDMTALHEILVLKEDAGYFAWFILIGSISILISTNSLLLTSCNAVEFNF